MKTRILITFVLFAAAFAIPGTSFAQNMGDDADKLWLSACQVGTGTDCDQSGLFHDAVAAPFSQSDSVAIGTVIQKDSMGENSIAYSISVDFYLKNYQPFDLLTVILNDTPPELQKFHEVWYYNSPVFNEGDLVFVYLVKNDGSYELLPESFALDKQESRGPPPSIHLTESPSEGTFLQGEKILVSGDVRKMELVKAAKNGERLDVELTLHMPYDESDVFFSDLMDIDADGHYSYHLDTSDISLGEYHLKVKYGPSSSSTDIAIDFNSKYWSPLKQFKSGVPDNEIQCRESLIPVVRHDGTPACVKPQTAEKLIERGWTIPLDTAEEKNPRDTTLFDSDAARAIDANNKFALDFYFQINESSENIFFSPWSISTAFAILQEGAGGNTSEQIREVFGFSAYSSQRQSGFKTINENLNASDDKYLLSIANSLWLAHGFSPYPEFVAVAKNNYESYVQEIDFQKDGVSIINAWVDEKTKKKIPELFVPGSLDSAVFAIANAIYFKGTWDNQFDPEKTQNAEFWRTNDSAVQVPMMYMHQSKQQIAFLDEVQLLELPYDGGKLSMLVLLPDEIDGLDKLESVISVEKIKEWKKELRDRSVVVIMPKFKLEADYELIPELQSMGISDLFGSSSDLGGISDLPLFVGEAVHKAVVEVNEEGTEAAAATGIGGFMGGPPSFVADHPFMFIIQDNETGNILFMGRVTDPTK